MASSPDCAEVPFRRNYYIGYLSGSKNNNEQSFSEERNERNFKNVLQHSDLCDSLERSSRQNEADTSQSLAFSLDRRSLLDTDAILHVLSYRKPQPLYKTSHLSVKTKIPQPLRNQSIMSQMPQNYENASKYHSKPLKSENFAEPPPASNIVNKQFKMTENINPVIKTIKEDLKKQLMALKLNNRQKVLSEKDPNLKPEAQYSFVRRTAPTTITFNTTESCSPRDNQFLESTVDEHHKSTREDVEQTPIKRLVNNSRIGFKKPTITASYVENNAILKSEIPQSRCLNCRNIAEAKKFYPTATCPASPLLYKEKNTSHLSFDNYIASKFPQSWISSSCQGSPIQRESPNVSKAHECTKSLNLNLSSLAGVNSPTEKVPGKIYPIIRIVSPDATAGKDAKVSQKFAFTTQSTSNITNESERARIFENNEPVFQSQRSNEMNNFTQVLQVKGGSEINSNRKYTEMEEKLFMANPKPNNKAGVLVARENRSIFINQPKGEEKGRIPLQILENLQTLQKESFLETDSGQNIETFSKKFTKAIKPPRLKQPINRVPFSNEGYNAGTKATPSTSDAVSDKVPTEQDSSASVKSNGSSKKSQTSSTNQLSESSLIRKAKEASEKAASKGEDFRKKIEEMQNKSKRRLTALLTSSQKLAEEGQTSSKVAGSETSSGKLSIEGYKLIRTGYTSAAARKDNSRSITAQDFRDNNPEKLVYPEETPGSFVLDAENDIEPLQTFQSNDFNLLSYSKDDENVFGLFGRK